jgi:hypothetical protein
MAENILSTIDEVIQSLQERATDPHTRGLIEMLTAVRENRCARAAGCIGCKAACEYALEERAVLSAAG